MEKTEFLQKIKTVLLALAKDVLAPTHAVRSEAKSLGNQAQYENFLADPNAEDPDMPGSSAPAPSITMRVITNLREYLRLRVDRLADKLELGGHFRGMLWLGLGIDKGASTTKISVIIANLDRANSVNNLILAGIYDGLDTYENLNVALNAGTPSIIAQLNDLIVNGVEIQGQRRNVLLLAVADMLCLCNVYGHMGVHSSFNCLLCEIPQRQLQASSPDYYADRNLATISADGEAHQREIRAGNRDSNALSK